MDSGPSNIMIGVGCESVISKNEIRFFILPLVKSMQLLGKRAAEQDLPEPAPKRQRVDTKTLPTIDFTALANKLKEKSHEQDGHIIWDGTRKKEAQTGQLRFHKRRFAAHQWYYLCINKLVQFPTNTRLVQRCAVPFCICHWDLAHYKLESVLDMNELDHILACETIDRNTRKEGDCLIWTGALNVEGYGSMQLCGRHMGAHKAAYMLANFCDVDDETDVICHKCPNKHRHCVSPDHLYLGTHEDNARDRKKDGTERVGSKNGNAVLTEDQVKQIVSELLSKKFKHEDIAKKYKVSQAAIQRIKSGKTWGHMILDKDKAALQDDRKSRSRLTKRTAALIKIDLRDGVDVSDCVEIYGVDERTVTQIRDGKKWSSINIGTSTIEEIDAKNAAEYYKNALQRLFKKCQVVTDEKFEKPHWLWQGRLTKDGHANLTRFKERQVLAHCASWMAANNVDKVPAEQILHKCLYKNCIQPDHLVPGTPLQNAQDRVRDGTVVRGERTHTAKISDATAKKIKLSKGDGTVAERAVRFGASIRCVRDIDRGKSWKHV